MTIKRAFWLAAMTVLSLTTHAQHFDWVKSYTGTDRPNQVDNWIVGSVTDRDGNLYVLGQCASNASLDGISLVPFSWPSHECILIAKFSPAGDVLWYKTIASPLHNAAQTIKLVGDTSIVCMVGVTLEGKMYWLDSLYTDIHSQMQLTDSLDWHIASAFLTLNLSGELIEQHFVQVSFIDNEGQLIMLDRVTGNPADSVWIHPAGIGNTFTLDGDGNIVVARVPSDVTTIYNGQQYDMYSIENGLLSGIQIWVDGHAKFRIYPQGTPRKWNPMLLKFSPHFSNLISYRYLFTDEIGTCEMSPLIFLQTDAEGCIYTIITESTFNGNEDASAVIAGLQTEFLNLNFVNSLVIKCNNNLTPVFAKQLTIEGSTRNDLLSFYSLAMDDSENKIFLSGSTSCVHDGLPVQIGDDSIGVCNNVFFVGLNAQSGDIVSFGTGYTDAEGSRPLIAVATDVWQHQMCVKNNRVFIPCFYWGRNLFGADSSYSGNNAYSAILIWDTIGHKVGLIDMPTNTPTAQPVFIISLMDSILYISGLLRSPSVIHLGDTMVSYSGNSTAFVSKYVDTSFMTPYIYEPQEPGSVSIRQVEYKADITIHPNPVSTILHVDVPQGESVRSCHVISANGMHQKERMVGNTLNLEKYPAGIYYIEIITNNNIHTNKIIKL